MAIKSCPKCKGPIDTSLAQSDGSLVCPQCNSKLKLNKPAAATNKPAADQGKANVVKPETKPAQPVASNANLNPDQADWLNQPTAPAQDLWSQLPMDQDPFGQVPATPVAVGDDPFYQDPFAQLPASNTPQSVPASPWTQYTQPAASVDAGAATQTAEEENYSDKNRNLMLVGGAVGGGLILAVITLLVIFKAFFGSSGTQGDKALAGNAVVHNGANEGKPASQTNLDPNAIEQYDPKPFRPMPGNLPDPSAVIIPTVWDVNLEAKQSQFVANSVGAALPHEKYLLASQQGPFAVGYAYPPDEWASRDAKKSYDSPEKLASLTPYDVIDLRTGKSLGQFQVPFIRSSDKLSPDGQHLVTHRMIENKYKWEIYVYQIGNPTPVMKQSFDYQVRYEFVGNDRLVLFSRNSDFAELSFYDLKTAQFINQIQFEKNKSAVDVIVSPDSYYLVLNPSLTVFSTRDGKNLGQLNAGPTYTNIKLFTNGVGDAPEITGLQFDSSGRYFHMAMQTRSNTRDGMIGTSQSLTTWDFTTGELSSSHVFSHQNTQQPLCQGPEPDTMIVGTRIIDLKLGIPIGNCPTGIVSPLGGNQYLALANLSATTNQDQLESLVEKKVKNVIGRVAIDMDRFVQSASEARKKELERVANDPKAPPPIIQLDKGQLVKVALQADPEWKVVPRVAPPAVDPKWQIAAERFLPRLAALNQMSDVDNGYRWHRFDLATGTRIGEPIRLNPRFGEVTNSGVVGPSQAVPSAAISRDGKTLAVCAYQNSDWSSQIDIWNDAGERLFGFTPYGVKHVRDLSFTEGGRLITSVHPKITCWDIANKKAIYELTCDFERFQYLPFKNWIVVATKAGSVEFLDAEDGAHLGRLPIPDWGSISPDGKTLFRNFEFPVRPGIMTPENEYWVEVWDLVSGKMSLAPEVPKAYLGRIWTNNRQVISLDVNSQRKTMVYDFDIHTHSHQFKFDKDFEHFGDTLGRLWYRIGYEDPIKPLDLSREKLIEGELALGPGKPINVVVDVNHPQLSPKIQLAYSKRLRDRGMVIGPGGFELKIWHSQSTYKHKVLNAQKTEDVYVDFPLHIFHTKLSAPDGKTVWESETPIQFSPFNSRYKRKEGYRELVETTYDGRAIEKASLDYNGRDPTLCQIEESLEDRTSFLQGTLNPNMPEFIFKTPNGYKWLPIEIEFKP